jgi:hypothetical protein
LKQICRDDLDSSLSSEKFYGTQQKLILDSDSERDSMNIPELIKNTLIEAQE